jgi:hypothetical protein
MYSRISNKLKARATKNQPAADEEPSIDQLSHIFDKLETCDTTSHLESVQKLFDYRNYSSDDFQELAKSLPPTWTICGLSLASNDTELIFSRWTSHSPPLVFRVELGEDNSLQDAKSILDSILEENKNSLEQAKNLQKEKWAEWWEIRDELDERMKDLTVQLEESILGCWKGMLLGSLEDASKHHDSIQLLEAVKKILQPKKSDALELDENLLNVFVHSVAHLSEPQIMQCIATLIGCSYPTSSKTQLAQLKKVSPPPSSHPFTLESDSPSFDSDVQRDHRSVFESAGWRRGKEPPPESSLFGSGKESPLVPLGKHASLGRPARCKASLLCFHSQLWRSTQQ